MLKRGRQNRDLELLYEVGCLRFIPRFWKRFLNADFQNLAEHHFRVAWIAMVIAKREKVGNIGKVLNIALVHDIAESRTGDTDYLSRQYVKQFREMAIQDVVYNTSLENEVLELVGDYEKRGSIEAKIVKDADTLDVDIELIEQQARGNPIRKEWVDNRKFLARNKLYTKTAKEMWDEMQKSNPHNWHKNGRNRFSANGDLSMVKKPISNAKAFVIPTKSLQKAGLIPKKRQTHIAYEPFKNRNELNLLSELAKNEGSFENRFGENGVEGNPSVQQIIMYGYFVTPEKKVLLYTRTSGSEKRLLGQSSIGLGGHLDLSHTSLASALYRQLDEEAQLIVNKKIKNFRNEKGNLDLRKMKEYIHIEPVAFIKDNINVGKDHFGIVCKITAENSNSTLQLRSPALLKTMKYITAKQYEELTDSGQIDPEIWTQIVFKHEIMNVFSSS
jgi:putative hydrolase of HD superfamily